MTDSEVAITTEAEANAKAEAEVKPPDKRAVSVGPLLLVTLGWLLALFALIGLRWPIDPSAPTTVGPHLSRLTTGPENETGAAMLARVVLNIGIYVVMLIGFGMLIAGWLRASRGALQAMVLVAALGLIYVAGQALYTGPMIAVCGFSLMLCGALIGWSAGQSMTDQESNSASTMNDPILTVEGTGTGDNAIHSAAS